MLGLCISATATFSQSTPNANAMQNSTEQSSERNAIIQTLQNIFIDTDNRNWEQVKAQFADQVLLDYTSMSGGEPSEITPQDIVDSWKGLLPGFKSTQHALSNFQVTIADDEADVFHYGTAWHHLPNEEGEDVWTVVGTYEHHLVKIDGLWKVDRMRFNLKFTDGNGDLPRLAQNRISEKPADEN